MICGRYDTGFGLDFEARVATPHCQKCRYNRGCISSLLGLIFKNHSQLILEPTIESVVSLSLRVYATPCPLLNINFNYSINYNLNLRRPIKSHKFAGTRYCFAVLIGEMKHEENIMSLLDRYSDHLNVDIYKTS
jgi:hypothetical protein